MSPHLKSVLLLRDQYPTREHYPFTLPLLQETERLDLTAPVNLFAGENGTGKSTLLEALARACGVHIWKLTGGVRRYQVNPYEAQLFNFLKPVWTDGKVPGSFFGSETFMDFKLLLDEWAASDPGQLKYFGGESLVTQSHGQSMMAFFHSRYKLKGVYFLDEPETGLSPKSQLELLDIIRKNSAGGHAQFFLATHSPILLACPNATIHSFDHTPPKPIPYKQTGHYKIYKEFLDSID